jgi:hypothetical protein
VKSDKTKFILQNFKIIIRAGHNGMLVIPAFRRLRQEEQKFEASLGYTASYRPDW